MIPAGQLKNLLAKPGYSRLDKLLMCLATDPIKPRQVREVRELAVQGGLRGARTWNISQVLSGSNGFAVRTGRGWELSDDGVGRVTDLAGSMVRSRARRVAAGLRHEMSQLANADAKAFLEEAIECLELGHYRAAVVLSWVGAVSVLHDHVVMSHLSDFNREASRRDSRWKAAKTAEDLTRMKESEFLNVLSGISVLGKSVKQELENGLRLRNGCGHPNALKVGEARAAGHVESLLLNVFAQF